MVKRAAALRFSKDESKKRNLVDAKRHKNFLRLLRSAGKHRRGTHLQRFIRNLDATDQFFPVGTWPYLYQEMITRAVRGPGHLNNPDRYSLYYFLVSNGLKPELAAQWILAGRVDTGGQIYRSRRYDLAARRQATGMIKQHSRGKLIKDNKRVHDMVLGYPVYGRQKTHSVKRYLDTEKDRRVRAKKSRK